MPLLSNDYMAVCTGLRTWGGEPKLKDMRAALSAVCFFLLSSAAAGQAPGTARFEVASVKPSQREVGADYNNQLSLAPSGITARNVTLRRLVSEAYGLQVRQVLGPSWLDQDEYDIEARTGEQANREQLDLMLRALIAERFNLRQHRETRVMQVYELRVDQAGAKVHSTNTEKQAKPGAGFHFHGDMRRFADFLAVQLSIPILDDPTQPGKAAGPAVPVLDRTELPGAYDVAVDVKPELGTDPFTLWQAALREQLGLKIERRRGSVDIVLVDSVARVPVSN